MASNEQLSDYHENQLIEFLKYQRAKRAQCLKEVDAEASVLKDTRLTEDAYSLKEAEGLLNDFSVGIKSSIETELQHISHTTILLLRQLFQQAENWKLNFKCDTSELENMELLGLIADFEEAHFGNKKAAESARLSSLHAKPSDSPLTRQIAELQAQLQASQEEVTKLKTEIKEKDEKLTKTRNNLEEAEATLAKRVDSSAQFQNLQRMLQNKIEQ
eukprot:JZ553251.1.p1 GENE.JZ553251.1~~JZ553251.1.p1  ORF type:complete len:216 (+),score=4.51 JZ553251.1:32-679(+)